MDEPKLEALTQDYDVIVLKHCFPVSAVEADTGAGDVACEDKRLENYFLQYEALQTEGGLYLKSEYANGEKDPHPNEAFCRTVAPSLCETIVQALGTGSDER